jgi:hypothetical protein
MLGLDVAHSRACRSPGEERFYIVEIGPSGVVGIFFNVEDTASEVD